MYPKVNVIKVKNKIFFKNVFTFYNNPKNKQKLSGYANLTNNIITILNTTYTVTVMTLYN